MKKTLLAISLASITVAVLAQNQTLPPPVGAEVKFPKSKNGAHVAAAVPAAAASAATQPPEPAKQAAAAPKRPVSAAFSKQLEQRVSEQKLPGLGTLPGEKQLTRANVIRVQSDVNEVAYISSAMPNRIATPFEAPRVIDSSDFEHQEIGQSVYILPKDSERPIALYVTGSNPNDPVVSLTLVPKEIPQQTIVLQLDAPLAKGSADASSEPAPTTDVYTDKIRYLLRQVALNKVPDGFVLGALPRAQAVLPTVVVTPVSRYSGQAYDIYRYRIKGTSATDVELSEESFYADGVRAVAFFPTAVLRQNDETTVFVIADKSATGN
jgi:conjugal transfer pilus assembly protein TraK